MSFVPIPANQWPDKATIKKCAKCNKSFGLFRPGSHCHSCGQVYCANTCLPFRFVLPSATTTTTTKAAATAATNEPVPVCAKCAEKLSQTQSEADTNGNNDYKESNKHNEQPVSIASSAKNNDNNCNNNNNLDSEQRETISKLQELLKLQKEASATLIHEAAILRSENIELLKQVEELKYSREEEKWHTDEYQLEQMEKLERLEIQQGAQQSQQKELELLLLEYHHHHHHKEEEEEYEQSEQEKQQEIFESVQAELKNNLEMELEEQRKVFVSRQQSLLNNVIAEVEDEKSEIYNTIIVDERNAFMHIVNEMLAEQTELIKADVKSKTEMQINLQLQPWKLKLLELEELSSRNQSSMEESEEKAQQWEEWYKERNGVLQKVKMNAQTEISHLQQQLHKEVELHHYELHDLQERYNKQIQIKEEEYREYEESKKQKLMLEERIKSQKQEAFNNAEVKARVLVELMESTELTSLLSECTTNITEMYNSKLSLHQAEVSELKDEFDAQLLEQHVDIVHNYKEKMQKLQHEHEQQMSKLTSELHATETTKELLQTHNIIHNATVKTQEINDFSSSNEKIHEANNNVLDVSKISEQIISEMSCMYDAWLSQHTNLLTHLETYIESIVLNRQLNKKDNNNNEREQIPMKQMEQTESNNNNNNNSSINNNKVTEVELQKILEMYREQEKQHEQTIVSLKREIKRLASQYSSATERVAELQLLNSKLQSKLQQKDEHAKALNLRTPHKNNITKTNKSEINTPLSNNTKNNNNRDNNNNNKNNYNYNTNQTSVQRNVLLLLLQERENKWWQFTFSRVWQYCTISSVYFSESLMMKEKEMLAKMRNEEGKRKAINSRSAFALEQTTSTIKVLQEHLRLKSDELLHKEEELQQAMKQMARQKAHALNCVKRMHAVLCQLKETEHDSCNETLVSSLATPNADNHYCHTSNSNNNNNNNNNSNITNTTSSSSLSAQEELLHNSHTQSNV